MVSVTRNCKAFTNVPGAALVVLEKIIPSNDFASPLRLAFALHPWWAPLLGNPYSECLGGTKC